MSGEWVEPEVEGVTATHLSVPLQVFPDGDGLLDHVVEILGDFRGQAFRLKNPQYFRPRHEFHLEWFDQRESEAFSGKRYLKLVEVQYVYKFSL